MIFAGFRSSKRVWIGFKEKVNLFFVNQTDLLQCFFLYFSSPAVPLNLLCVCFCLILFSICSGSRCRGADWGFFCLFVCLLVLFAFCLFLLNAVAAGAEVLIGVPMDDGRSRSVAGH